MSAGQYDDSNRAFVQAFMARGTLTFKEARPLLAAIFSVKDGETVRPDEVTMADFDSYVHAASAALSPFDYEIRSTLHQVSKERIWALVNTTSDALTQLATVRTADEIAFIKRVLDAMFETYNTERQEVMAITSMQAMKVAKADERRRQSNGAGEESQSADKGLTHGQAEKLMLSLVEEGWFERSEKGWFTLSPRALMELKSWLSATYNDPDAEAGEWQHIKNCEACKGIVTMGQRCSEVSCIVRLHEGCLGPFWRTRREEKCPKCKTPWKGLWVGEKAVTTTEAYNRGRRISGGGNRRPAQEDEEEEEGENGAEGEEREDDEDEV
ncbi:hypothetical protein V496_10625 [Pseudogymnoascus sp. VKM F-4515 (FW-2607)]|nr:hypothetical protein V496_10625 [Pseudogymnoascus sp. VKM F-4515 (FW-2607)]KFY97152.1 hypothetical protein V498_02221 [Pseudogymnoascus sp. VKM F-4517 (FW-2822)]